MKTLYERCAEIVQEHLDDLRNDRAGYEGYAQRQARYDVAIAEDEAVLAELLGRRIESHEAMQRVPAHQHVAGECDFCERWYNS